MKTRLIAHLTAYLERSQARQRQRWQRTRRIGRTGFILLLVLYFWLMMAAVTVFGIWISGGSFHKLLKIPHHSWGEIFAMTLFGAIGIYFTGAYTWRLNERRYGNQDRK